MNVEPRELAAEREIHEAGEAGARRDQWEEDAREHAAENLEEALTDLAHDEACAYAIAESVARPELVSYSVDAPARKRVAFEATKLARTTAIMEELLSPALDVDADDAEACQRAIRQMRETIIERYVPVYVGRAEYSHADKSGRAA